MYKRPKVIVFDAFGTLVKIGESLSPYRKLMKWLRANGRKPTPQDAKIIMVNALNVEQLAKHFGYVIPLYLLDEINADLQFELNSIELYEDTVPIIQELKNYGFKIALCSNLAMPYGEYLKKILPDLFDVIVFSYEVGTIKPEPQIYENVRSEFSCGMSDMHFIGDHPILDVEQPISLGMSAKLIVRNKKQSLDSVLSQILN